MLNYILLVAMATTSIVGLVLALKSKPGSAQRFFVAVATVVALSIAVSMATMLFPSIFIIERLAIAAAVLLSLIVMISLIVDIATTRRNIPPADKVDSSAAQASTEKVGTDPTSREAVSEPTGGVDTLDRMMGD